MCITKKKSDLNKECSFSCPHFKFKPTGSKKAVRLGDVSASTPGIPICSKHNQQLERLYGGTNRTHTFKECGGETHRYQNPHDNPIFKADDDVIIIDTTWKSLIGKTATVCSKQDADDPNKVRVEFDEDYIGYFYPEQLQIDNTLHNTDSIINYLSHVVTHSKSDKIEIEKSKLQNIIDIIKDYTNH